MIESLVKEEIEFLKESNAIEDVFDDLSLEQAKVAWDYLLEHNEISLHIMLKTHKILMLHQPLLPNEKGYIRRVPVYIANREGLNWRLIPPTLSNLVMNMNDVVNNGKKENKEFLEKLIQDHHVKYEKIHPFVDGNGRTGRMFMNWERLKVGLPLLTIKASERGEYYKWFK